MEIGDLTCRVRALEFTNEDHQQPIEEKDTTIALLNDDLKNCEYKNVSLQGEIRVKDPQIAALQRRYVLHVGKHTTSANDKFHDLPYYVATIQRRKRYVKLR